MTDVFISYKSDRKAAVRYLSSVLEAYGYKVWWDYGLAAGINFRRQIEEKLEGAKAVLVLWCSLSRDSEWVEDEAETAKECGTYIPVRIEDIKLPMGFRRAQTIDLTPWSGHPTASQLEKVLEALEQRVGERVADKRRIRELEELWRQMKNPRLIDFQLVDAPDPTLDPVTSAALVAEPLPSPSFSATSSVSHSTTPWKTISNSVDLRDYIDFVELFPNAPEQFDARRRCRLLEAWSEVDKLAVDAIEAFRELELFDALEVASRRALEDAKDKSKARTKETPRPPQQSDLPSPNGPRTQSVLHATKDAYRLSLENVAGWPDMELSLIPEGNFVMGADSDEVGAREYELPKHPVEIDSSFLLGRCTVTFDAWDAALAAGAPLHTPNDYDWGRGSRPVIQVSYYDALEFLAWLNEMTEDGSSLWRLPTEAEWEYACRAGTSSPFSTGASISTDQANFDGTAGHVDATASENREKTIPVGQFAPNAFGLYDMHGNVREWTADCWNADYTSAPSDGSTQTVGDESRRVVRGGSWYVGPSLIRSASRNRFASSTRSDNIGFRIAKDFDA